jgi:diacylglycerol kinase
MSKTHSTFRSFGYAWDAIIAIVLGLALKLSSQEWIILSFTIAFVLILEFINTALEAIVDMVSPRIRQEAKLAKDVAAAAVLVSAILSVVVGIFLFLPKILLYFKLILR